ncbi:hypothetical protein BDEG_27274 [Batrachochytrium dendrobatidis JEL423]|nr:hypothetical protein BDEG_27274 [Batrachochytrium dendrobatidis JEL423]
MTDTGADTVISNIDTCLPFTLPTTLNCSNNTTLPSMTTLQTPSIPLLEAPSIPPALFFRLRLPDKLSTVVSTNTSPTSANSNSAFNKSVHGGNVNHSSLSESPHLASSAMVESPADLLQSFRFTSHDRPLLQSPLRPTPNHQATITTDGNLAIKTANVVFCRSVLCPENGVIGRSILDFFDSSYRTKYAKLISASKASLQTDAVNTVMVCGSVVRLIRKNGSTLPASLWLKEKKSCTSGGVYIWVFEEIDELQAEVMISKPDGIITRARGDIHTMFGYDESELLQNRFSILLPNIDCADGKLDFDQLHRFKFFGGRSKRGLTFPVITRIIPLDSLLSPESLERQFASLGISVPAATQASSTHAVAINTTQISPTDAVEINTNSETIRIIAMPNLAGVITIFHSGVIHSINNVFSKYLFGRSGKELVYAANITDLIPNFWAVFETLHIVSDTDSIPLSRMTTTPRCSSPVASFSGSPDGRSTYLEKNRSWTVSSGDLSLPHSMSATGLIAKHRDGSEFLVDAHARPLFIGHEHVFAIWITYRGFHRSLMMPSILGSTSHNQPFSDSPDTLPKTSPIAMTPNNDTTNFSEPKKNDVEDATTVDPIQVPTESVPTDNVCTTPPVLLPTPAMTPPKTSTEPAELATIDDYTIVKSIGEGAYGFVRLAYRTLDPEKTPLVIKYVVKTRVLSWCRRENLGGRIPVEAAILYESHLHPHPNVVDMIECFQDEFYVYIVMRHSGNMDLFQFIESNPTLPESLIRHLFRQCTLAVEHLHKHDIVHRDIKDENVVIDTTTYIAQLIDFGSGAFLDTGKPFTTFYGTMDFAAPEVLEGNPYNGKPQDMWALGILLYTLIYKENPFYSVDEILADHGLRIPFTLSNESLDLLESLLSHDVEKRPTIEQCLQHPWFTKELEPY